MSEQEISAEAVEAARSAVEGVLGGTSEVRKAIEAAGPHLIRSLIRDRDRAREEVGLWKWRANLYEQERDNLIAKYREPAGSNGYTSADMERAWNEGYATGELDAALGVGDQEPPQLRNPYRLVKPIEGAGDE